MAIPEEYGFAQAGFLPSQRAEGILILPCNMQPRVMDSSLAKARLLVRPPVAVPRHIRTNTEGRGLDFFLSQSKLFTDIGNRSPVAVTLPTGQAEARWS
jgi:hypothetical protein